VQAGARTGSSAWLTDKILTAATIQTKEGKRVGPESKQASHRFEKKLHCFFQLLQTNLHLHSLMIGAGRSSNWIIWLAG
jgi:hypothetical protein